VNTRRKYHTGELALDTIARRIETSWIEYNRTILIDKALTTDPRISSIIDVGCGDGSYCTLLSKRFLRCGLLVGVDISKEDVMQAKQKSHERISYIVADANALPFRDSAFHLAFTKDTLHHIEKPFEVLTEIKRIVKGKIVIVEVSRYNPIMQVCTFRRHLHFTPKQLKAIVKSAGLEIESLTQISAYPSIPLRVRKTLMLLWNAFSLAFLYACYRVPVLPRIILNIFARFFGPSYCILHVR